MLGWFYRRLFDGIMAEAVKWLAEPETQQRLTDFFDSVMDRQMARLNGSMGQNVTKLGGGSMGQQILQMLMDSYRNRQSLNPQNNSNNVGLLQSHTQGDSVKIG